VEKISVEMRRIVEEEECSLWVGRAEKWLLRGRKMRLRIYMMRIERLIRKFW
jgi:hypothetical protein